ncbi:hypothetical protein [Subtercola sp. Z020]|uniref:hypothetical protein n=1 Tax=Subtercola sp. Z020 TaxID=2080582 RepID=UPI0011B0D8F4|nr:hypothetical protein [Subtercola sp. Z020]
MSAVTPIEAEVIEFFRANEIVLSVLVHDEPLSWREVDTVDDCEEALYEFAYSLADPDRVMEEHLALLRHEDAPYSRPLSYEIDLLHRAETIFGVRVDW